MPRVFSIRVPSPLAQSDTSVHGILADGLTLIDTGVGTALAFKAVQEGLEREGLFIADIDQIVLTHKHPDHWGLARRLQQESGARVFVHRNDWADVQYFHQRSGDFVKALEGYLRGWGAPESQAQLACALVRKIENLAQPVAVEPLVDGDSLPLEGPDLRVLHTPGHTPGSICLTCGPYLFTGDHLLPRGLPSTGVGEIGDGQPLRKYLQSLERLRTPPGPVRVVLPGHGERIDDLNECVRSTLAHHRKRTAGLLQVLVDGVARTVYAVAEEYFGPLQSYHIAQATAEVHSHLEFAEAEGMVVRKDGRYKLA